MLDIKDRPGVISKATMHTYFERSIQDTAALRTTTVLGAVTVNGQFSHYANPNTDSMWLGFALGMRCAERVPRHEAMHLTVAHWNLLQAKEAS